MSIKLRILRGKLEKRRGGDAGIEVPVRRTRFLIGAAADCNLRCPSRTVSAHHCELRVEAGQITLCDLESESGTFVNEERLIGHRRLAPGDCFRIGRLAFELVIEAETEGTDTVANFVSDLLVEADEHERVRRLEDPRSRRFQVDQAEQEPLEEVATEVTQLTRPPKKPPGKLPEPPKFVADDPVEAAEETLTKLFNAHRKRFP